MLMDVLLPDPKRLRRKHIYTAAEGWENREADIHLINAGERQTSSNMNA